LMDKFLKTLKKNLDEQFPGHRIEFLIWTMFSLKVNIHLEKNYFISLRYNARNGRMDIALITNKQRIFGYDNLKTWHYHPYENPSSHVSCDPPSLETMLADTKKYYEIDKQKQ
jgi:hypothetical protein